MNKLCIIIILFISILFFSLVSVYAQDIIDVSIDGNASVFICHSYEYNVTLTNTSVNQSAVDINYDITLPTGFSTSDPQIISIPFLGPGQLHSQTINVFTLCSAEPGNISVDGGYNSSLVTISSTKPISVLQGAVTIEKTPSTQSATLEDNVSWTIKVTSTGLGPIRNVVITDELESGLQYLSSSPQGDYNPSTGTVEWNSTHIPELAYMVPGDEVEIEINAKVIECDNLFGLASVSWGCNGTCETQETIASIAFQPNPPKIDYTVPDFNINYCGVGNRFTIPITNSGSGTAYDFNLSVSFGGLSVENISPQGASYSGGKFIVGDIPTGTTNLEFDLVPTSGWCEPLPSGSLIFRPEYLYCNQEFRPPVRLGSYSVSEVPSVSVSKTGAPRQMYLGGQITYNITASYSGPIDCGIDPASNIVVVDTIPDGFSIIDAGGGDISGNTITWTVAPSVGLTTSIILQSPTYDDCEYCYTTAINTVTATVTDCCGCARTSSASQSTILECSETVTSSKTVSSDFNFQKCTPLKYTNSFSFPNLPFWDDVNISNLNFIDEMENDQALQGQVIIDINGCAVDYTPTLTSPLSVNFSDVDFSTCPFDPDTTSVRNTNINIEYNMSTQDSSSPGCSSGSFFSWSILDTGKTGTGDSCYLDQQQIRIGTFVDVNDAQMSIGISGLPQIVDKCGTYDITLALNRTSSVGAYNVTATFPLENYHINSISYGGHTPIEFNNSPLNFEWDYEDYFENNNEANVTMNVTKRCNDPEEMNANISWNGLCNIGDPQRSCSTSASRNPLVLSGDVCLIKVPEILWATENQVTWRLCILNAGSGASYNVWLEDILGSGLSYNSSWGTYSQVYINQNRLGDPINGATWIIDKIYPGDEVNINLTANIESCTDLTNLARTSAGCLGVNCQPIKTDDARVRIPASSLITTNTIPSHINMCGQEQITIIARNTGLTNVYDVNVTATLPTGIFYVPGIGPSPEDPNANPLRWTKDQIPALGDIARSGEVAITFNVRSSCDMEATGAFTSRASYMTPCKDSKLSPQASSEITRRLPNVTIEKVGRNLTAGQTTFSNHVAAEPGDRVEWRLRITNNGNAPANNVEFWDVLPTNMTFENINTSEYPGGGTTPLGEGTAAEPWEHGTLSNVSGSNEVDYYLWGTVNPLSCGANTTNRAFVRYGCDDGCRFDQAQSSLRQLRTQPNFIRSQSFR